MAIDPTKVADDRLEQLARIPGDGFAHTYAWAGEVRAMAAELLRLRGREGDTDAIDAYIKLLREPVS